MPTTASSTGFCFLLGGWGLSGRRWDLASARVITSEGLGIVLPEPPDIASPACWALLCC